MNAHVSRTFFSGVVTEAVRANYAQVSMRNTDDGLDVTITESDGFTTSYTLDEFRINLTADEFTELATSMYSVGWRMTFDGTDVTLSRHRDASCRANARHRWAAVIEPLQRSRAAYQTAQ